MITLRDWPSSSPLLPETLRHYDESSVTVVVPGNRAAERDGPDTRITQSTQLDRTKTVVGPV